MFFYSCYLIKGGRLTPSHKDEPPVFSSQPIQETRNLVECIVTWYDINR